MPARSPRLVLAAGVLVAAGIGSVIAATAAEASPPGTTVTFTISSGSLDISMPATADLGTEASGNVISAQLGAVTVTDTRALLVASWSATAVATDFTTGTETNAETVPSTGVSYWSGPATSTTGSGTFTPGQAAADDATAIDSPATAFALSNGVGNSSATWNPTVIVALPAAAVSGVYTGTVTHSVA